MPYRATYDPSICADRHVEALLAPGPEGFTWLTDQVLAPQRLEDARHQASPAELGVLAMLSALGGEDADALILAPVVSGENAGPIDAIVFGTPAVERCDVSGIRWRQRVLKIPHSRFWVTRLAIKTPSGIAALSNAETVRYLPVWAQIKDTASLAEALKDMPALVGMTIVIAVEQVAAGAAHVFWIVNGHTACLGGGAR